MGQSKIENQKSAIPDSGPLSPLWSGALAAVALAAVLALVFRDAALRLCIPDPETWSRSFTAKETVRDAWLILAATLAVGCGTLLALFGSFRLLREPALVFAAILVTLILHSMFLAQIGYIPDEAYVRFVCARNLVQHGQPTFALGEYAESYARILWVLLLAPFVPLSKVMELEVVARGLAVVASVPTVSLLYLLGRRSDPDRSPMWALLAPLLLILFPAYALSSTMALETQLATFLVFLGAYLYLVRKPTACQGFWPIPLLLACFARADAVVFLLATFAFEGCRLRREKAPLRHLSAYALAAAAVLAGYWAVIAASYGASALGGVLGRGPATERALRGAYYAGSFLVKTLGLTAFLIPLAAVVAGWNRRTAYAAVLAVVGLGYAALAGGDALPGYGLVLPVAPLLFYLFQESAAALHARLPAAARGGATPLNLVLLLALTFTFPIPFFRQEAQLAREAASHATWGTYLRQAGDLLRRDPDPNATMAIREPGLVAFTSGKPVIDLSGRYDRVVRALGADATPYILSDCRPKYIVLTRTLGGRWSQTGREYSPVEERLLGLLRDPPYRFTAIPPDPRAWRERLLLVYRLPPAPGAD